MKIEFESFNQMQFRHFTYIVNATGNLFRDFKIKTLAYEIVYFISETAFFPIKNTRRYKAWWLRRRRRTRDKLRRKTNGFLCTRDYRFYTLVEKEAGNEQR